MVGKALRHVNTVFDFAGKTLSAPGHQCGEQGNCHRAMGSEYSNIRYRQVSAAQTDRCVRFVDIFEKNQRRFFGLKKPLMRRDCYRVSLFKAIEAVTHSG